MFTKVLAAAIVAAASTAQAQNVEYSQIYTGAYQVEDVEFNMRYIGDSDTVEFMVKMQDQGWFGLVINSGDMSRGNDMIVFHADGSDSYARDYHSIGYGPPDADKQDDLDLQFLEYGDDERMTFVVRRQRNTYDEEDTEIPLEEPFTLGYAYNSESADLSYSTKHQIAGSLDVYVYKNGEPSQKGTLIPEPVDNVGVLDVIAELLQVDGATTFATGVSMATAIALALF